MSIITRFTFLLAICFSIASSRVLPDDEIIEFDGSFNELLGEVRVEGAESVYAEVTYPEIGTFTTNDFYDATHRPIVELPQSPEHINTKFLLHTRHNLKDHQELKLHATNLIKSSNFNASNPTKFIVHGFIDNQLFGEWMKTLKDEFLTSGDYNVIIVDWSGGNGLPYAQATANTRVVGPVMAILINDLVNTTGIDLSSVHILGHSLGSHVAGYAGQRLKGAIGRITGLDPAGPYFEGMPANVKLDPSDAVFVDAIHTDARHLIPDLGFGTYETSGHIDFYPNGGVDQPGCNSERVTTIFTEGLTEGARRLVACNHQRAVDFYSSSINHKAIKPVAYQCADFDSFKNGKCTECGASGEMCAVLGPEVEQWSAKFQKTNSGKRFFFRTGEHYPFFRFEYEVEVKLASGHADQHGTMRVTIYTAKNVESTDLNEEDEVFKHGNTYRYIKTTENDLTDVNRVSFRWDHFLGILLKGKLYVESITFSPLTSPNIMNRTLHANEIKKLCAPKSATDGVENEKSVDFATSNC